jgi:Rrf2 family iron-sulfur cluster assembly transcriptional regulator
MKLSTRSRYGTRMMLDLAQHSDEAPIQISDIARRQNISVKYLEQLIIPLKKANFIKSVRGPKGGHMLAKSPEKITIGQIVKVLEGETNLTRCIENPGVCRRAKDCPTRDIWGKATRAMYNELDSVTLSEMLQRDK